MAQALSAGGARVAMTARDGAQAQRVADELDALGLPGCAQRGLGAVMRGGGPESARRHRHARQQRRHRHADGEPAVHDRASAVLASRGRRLPGRHGDEGERLLSHGAGRRRAGTGPGRRAHRQCVDEHPDDDPARVRPLRPGGGRSRGALPGDGRGPGGFAGHRQPVASGWRPTPAWFPRRSGRRSAAACCPRRSWGRRSSGWHHPTLLGSTISASWPPSFSSRRLDPLLLAERDRASAAGVPGRVWTGAYTLRPILHVPVRGGRPVGRAPSSHRKPRDIEPPQVRAVIGVADRGVEHTGASTLAWAAWRATRTPVCTWYTALSRD
jgi:hypothetical protein